MTRLAIVSDIHGDVHALQDALRQIERLGCDLVVCAGDLVDYGVFPRETIALIHQSKIPCVRGNHDRWAVGRGRAGASLNDASGWDLPRAALSFLAELPPTWRSVFEGVRVVVCHGNPRSDMDGLYPDQLTAANARRWLDEADADVLVVGHTHIAFVAQAARAKGQARGLIVNPGALLRDPAGKGDSPAWIYNPDTKDFVRAPVPARGTFGVLELPALRFTVHSAADGHAGFLDRRSAKRAQE